MVIKNTAGAWTLRGGGGTGKEPVFRGQLSYEVGARAKKKE